MRFAFWNEKDPILKERLFGLTNLEGNHGEDVKEYYYYLQATPTSSYLQFLYKYPQAEYPYDQLVAENRRRSRHDPEYELIDTGIFGENRYFDIFVEYAKATSEEMLVRITAWNRGPEPARLHALPTLWFRNRWSWGDPYDMPHVAWVDGVPGAKVVEMHDYHYGMRWLLAEGNPELLFTNNETNTERLYNEKNRTPYVKDAFHRYLIGCDKSAVNPALSGTKMAAHYVCEIPPGKSWTLRLRFTDRNPSERPTQASQNLRRCLRRCFRPAHEGGGRILRRSRASEGERRRAAWSSDRPSPGCSGASRATTTKCNAGSTAIPRSLLPIHDAQFGRNHDWTHLYNSDVILMPDKWEYPWYAAWDLGFHCVTMATDRP